jgi:6-phosphogluconolactonase/glucosamine-6-phosphate isomerase/deaminase
MMIEICQEEKQMIAKANAWLADRIMRYQASSLFLPAGKSPQSLYAAWRQSPPSFLAGIDLQQIDEVIADPQAGIFSRFFSQELPAYSVRTILNEKERLPKADLALLGFGKNGHVGFHEPGLPASFKSGEVELSAETKSNLHLSNSARGWTYGTGTFLKSKAVCMIVWGSGKENAWRSFLREEKIPAAFLKNHPDLTILVDARLTSQE